MERGASFNADRDLRIDIVIERGGFRDASASNFRHNNILPDVTYTDPQAGGHVRAGSADQDGSAASISEPRKRNHYARVGHVSFDECSHRLVTLAVESFVRLVREGNELIDPVATSMAGERGGGAMAKKGIFKERILHIVSKYISGWCFVPSSPVQTRVTGLSSDKEERRGGGADADGVGLSHRC